MAVTPGPGRLRFAPFVFDRGSAELSRDGARIRLQALPCQLLAVLLERPGEIVTRDDLRERLWHADTFVDFEHGLNTAVKKLRQALGDSAEAPTFIETVARRGYRFIAPVELLPSPELALTSAAPPAADPPGAPAVPAPAGAFPRPTVWFVAIAVVVLAAGVGWWNLGRADPSSAAAAAAVRTPTQLAVVPFRVLPGPDLESGYLGIGIADAITTRLAATRQIGVRSSSAVLPFAASQDDPVAIAASLGVEHLVVGAIQVTESAYRITVQLVRADGVAVWGRSYDEPRTALLDLQDDLAEQVVGALRLELGATERARLTFHYTDNAAAHEVYLRGRSLLLNYNEAKMLEAIKYFEQALALDGNYALARTGIATACAWFSVRYAHETDELGWAQRAQAEAMRALEQDGSLAEAHLALANAAGTTYGGFDWKTLLDRTATALSLNSSLELAHLARMRAYYHLGLFDAARREGREAERLNPSPSVERERLEVALLLFGGEFAAAVERAEALMQRSDAPEIYLGLARFYVGDTAGARKILASIMRGPRPDTRAQASLASIEAAAKLDRQARARLTRIEHASDIDHHVAYSVGAAYAQLGQADASLQWLEQAADTGFPCHVWFSRDPLLDPLRTHPRFVRLLARMEAAHTDSRPPSH